jgi:hypothetical protein
MVASDFPLTRNETAAGDSSSVQRISAHIKSLQ